MVGLGTHSRKSPEEISLEEITISWERYIYIIIYTSHILHSDIIIYICLLYLEMQFSMNTDETIDRFLCLSWSCPKM